MKPCLIIKTGEKIPSLESIPGDDEDWIATGMGLDGDEVRVVAAYLGEELPDFKHFSGAVITGSGAMVTDGDAWIENSAAWLRDAVEHQQPILGICFGHQLLAHALGGKVGDNPAGFEVGSIDVILRDEGCQDPLLGNLPPEFTAQLGHCQSVHRLPEGARLLAASEMDPHQAFSWGECTWGLQFHPEFNEVITRHFIDFYRDHLHQQGDDTDALMESCRPSPESHSLLAHFATIVKSRQGYT